MLVRVGTGLLCHRVGALGARCLGGVEIVSVCRCGGSDSEIRSFQFEARNRGGYGHVGPQDWTAQRGLYATLLYRGKRRIGLFLFLHNLQYTIYDYTPIFKELRGESDISD